ncbi:MAG: cytochrome P450 [Firmicutes bacterium]|nr:cytochrome P450 [Bacillota bacterium]
MSMPGPRDGGLARLRFFHRDPLGLFQSLIRDFGPRVQFRMGPWTFFLLNESESVGQVLAHHRPHFHKGPGLEPSNPLIGQGLLTSDEDDWIEQRRALAPVFRPQNISSMRPWLEEAVDQSLQNWEDGEPFDLESRMLRLSLTLALHTLFADPSHDDWIPEIGSDVTWLMDHFYRRSRSVWRFPYNVPGFNRRYHAHAQRLRRVVDRLTPTTPPFDTVWPHVSKERERRYHQTLTLIVAGFETTGHAMAWAIDLMARHPAVESKVLQESGQDVFPTPETHPWTHAVLLESLRLYPPVWLLSRRAVHDVTLGDLRLPERSITLISPWLMHRNADVYPEASHFRPERWLGWKPESPYDFIPFGAGPRRCIGEHLALTEALMAVSRIVNRYRLIPTGPRDIFPGLTLGASAPMWVTATPRAAARGG